MLFKFNDSFCPMFLWGRYNALKLIPQGALSKVDTINKVL